MEEPNTDKKKHDIKPTNRIHKPKGSKHRNQLMRQEIEKLEEMKSKIADLTAEDLKSFADLPISEKTLIGLTKAGFTVPTKVQRQSLIYSLGGHDVVAAAKTGSGKTLAFIIPILEKLYCKTWTSMDGLGALVITPVRELAYQIFDVLNKIGKAHDFSAGLVIGGTDLEYEWSRVCNCNIMICTPGRLLQHMTENPEFLYENLQVLVFDEADMCLSMGFAETMNVILEEMPKDRQTLLYSATQTRNVKDLIRAGCQNPVFCSVHEHSKTTTPMSLVESYVVCEAHDKFKFLYSFVQYHKKMKILVFLSTCKQVKYIFSMFCKLQPGLVVMGLHGNMSQLRRMAVYDQFCRKQSGVLFATDVAARGLDIPEVHWVIQADCPNDADTYIHRAGRTARYSKAGEALLLLTSSEETAMMANLKAKNIPVEKIDIEENQQRSISVKVEIILTKYNEMKEDAVRAFQSYIKHIAQLKDKKVFNVLSIDRDAYARSLGLIVTPRVRFLEKLLKQKFGDKYSRVKDGNDLNGAMNRARVSTLDFGTNDSDENDDDGLFVSSKDQTVPLDVNINPDQPRPLSKKKKKMTKEDIAIKLARKNIIVNKKDVFDDEGNMVIDPTKVQVSYTAREQEMPSQGINIAELKKIIRAEDVIDRKIHKAKLKEKRQEKKMKETNRRKKAEDDEDGGDEDEDDDAMIDDIIADLPDPDKIYNQKSNDNQNSEDENDDSDEGSSENEESGTTDDDEPVEKAPKISGKRKARLNAREAKRAKLPKSTELGDLPVDEQEQLALFLLSGKN